MSDRNSRLFSARESKIDKKRGKSIMVSSALASGGKHLDLIFEKCGRKLKLTKEELKNLILKFETHCTTVKLFKEQQEGEKS
jgi:hypothetical protein